MSSFEGGLIFGGLALIVILPIVAIAAVYFLGRQTKNKFQHIIEMDGAKCFQARDGSVIIKANTWINFWVLIFLLAVLAICGFVGIDNLSRGTGTIIDQVLMVGLVAVLIIPTVFYLLRALRRSSFYFNLEPQTLEIRRGLSKRQIPFREMVKLSVAEWHVDISGLTVLSTGIYRREELPGVQLKLELKTDEVLELGTLSSIKGQEDLWERCKNICHLVAGATGAGLPPDMVTKTEKLV